jgi:hypothetical protein
VDVKASLLLVIALAGMAACADSGRGGEDAACDSNDNGEGGTMLGGEGGMDPGTGGTGGTGDPGQCVPDGDLIGTCVHGTNNRSWCESYYLEGATPAYAQLLQQSCETTSAGTWLATECPDDALVGVCLVEAGPNAVPYLMHFYDLGAYEDGDGEKYCELVDSFSEAGQAHFCLP